MNTKKPSNEIVRLARAFGYSLAGLRYALSQPAFRIELIAFLLLVPLAFRLTESAAERALLIGSLWLVLIVELLNTGIERAIDRISADWHDLSKKAKDVASAAVLLSLLNAATIWLVIVLG
jgi:diacylglycerol kinase (ATP)